MSSHREKNKKQPLSPFTLSQSLEFMLLRSIVKMEALEG